MPRREPFDPKRPLVAARDFIFAGIAYAPGDPFPSPEAAPAASFPRRLIERQYETMAVNHAEEAAEEVELVQMAPAKRNGSYDITAPWLEKPLTIRGKVNAEKALAEMREEGPPLGWIEGGSEVEVEESGGGWYAITAPWLDEPEKVQGREAAEARQREIHDAGAPAPEEGGADDDAVQGGSDQGAPEGAGANEASENGQDDNPVKSESEEPAAGDASEGSGTDDADKAEGADTAGEAVDGADGTEAGSGDDPAAA